MNGKLNLIVRQLPLMTLVVFAGVIGFAGYWYQPDPVITTRYYMKNTGGAVLFNHKNHVVCDPTCENCHHEILRTDSTHPCDGCHGPGMDENTFTHAELMRIDAHTCLDCHDVDQELAPQSCRSCHPSNQDADEAYVMCVGCHDDTYDKDLLTHDEMLEIEEHFCTGCHNARTRSDAYHEHCQKCHSIERPDRFINHEGGNVCQACHLK